MRHQNHNKKLGRSGAHRNALVAALVAALIKRRSIITTVAKAKEARRTAERLVTIARKGTIAARRLVIARIHDTEASALLFKDIVPLFADRKGGYTRVVRVSRRRSDGAEYAILQWTVQETAPAAEKKTVAADAKKPEAAAPEKKDAGKKAPAKKEKAAEKPAKAKKAEEKAAAK